MPNSNDKLQDFFTSMGKRISAFRINKGFTLEELGFAIGVDKSAMHRIERGKKISMYTLIKLSLALDVPLKRLLDFKYNLSPEDLDSIIKSKK